MAASVGGVIDQFRPSVIKKKASLAIEHHRDPAKPGRPLILLVPGGVLAVASLGLLLYIAVETWLLGNFAEAWGLQLIAWTSPAYVIGVFAFSLGYERYDAMKALGITALVVILTVGAFILLRALLLVIASVIGGGAKALAEGGGGGSKSDSKSSSSSGKTSEHASGGGFHLPSISFGHGGLAHPASSTSTQTIPSARAVFCPHCHRTWIPGVDGAVCPFCGAAAPVG